MSKHLEVDPKKCVSCRSCELACSFGHYDEINPKLARVKVFYFEDEMITVPVTCLQCDEASCAAVCPTKALHRNADGTIVHDDEKCIKCKLCVSACPLGNISYKPQINNVIKCDLCGGDPKCAKFCPTGAISFVDTNESSDKQKTVAENFKETMMTDEDKVKENDTSQELQEVE